jgi:hypothetical protein
VVGRPLEGGSPFHGGGGWQTISPDYFAAFRIPIKRGRAFTERDGPGAPPVVIINQAMARQFWPKSDPLNDKIWIGRGLMAELGTEVPRQIVGIVGDVRGAALNQDPNPTMYVPNGQIPDALNALNVRLTPLAWLSRDEQTRFDNMPTEFGPVTLRWQLSRDGGTLNVDYTPRFRRTPKTVFLHVPAAPELTMLRVNGREQAIEKEIPIRL